MAGAGHGEPGAAVPAASLGQSTAVSAYTRAELDLLDINYSLDPAYKEWHRASEEAQDNLIDVLHLLRSTPATLAMDAPLRKIALLIHAMRDDPETARDLHTRMEADFERQFRVRGLGATAQHRNLLLNLCRPLLARFAGLPLFDAGPDLAAAI